MPSVDFEDKDLLNAIQNETGLDMAGMVIVNKKIVDGKLNVFYRPKRAG